MNVKEKLTLEKLIDKINWHQELAGDTSSDTETETSVATAHSNTSDSSSQVTSPRSSLLWDHGYDLAESSIDTNTDEREGEWRKFNVTDDDKLTADKQATADRTSDLKPTENNNLDCASETNTVESTINFLPDLLAGTAQAKMADSPVESLVDYSVQEMSIDESELALVGKDDSPPPLPTSSPPPLPMSNINDDRDAVFQTEQQDVDKQEIKREKTHENLHAEFKNLLEFDQNSCNSNTNKYSKENDKTTNESNKKSEDDVDSHSDDNDFSDEDMKTDIEEEFEAILHAFDLNFGQDTYVERFAGRRDKYGFILSPIVEAPSPTPSSLSGYSGISSASPDPFSVFRMSPAPRGGRIDLDLSSLGMYSGEVEDYDHTVPIYQTVQAKRAIVIPEGYGWESGDDLLSPTGSGEWDVYENGLSTPPVSTSGINLSQFGTHVLGWKKTHDAIIEEAESESDTVDGDSSSAYDSNSTIDEAEQDDISVIREKSDMNVVDLHDENQEITSLTNIHEDSVRNTSPYEVLKASQKNISLYLNNQSDRKRPDSQQSLVSSEDSSNCSGDEDAEDEYSDSDGENENNFESLLSINTNNVTADGLLGNDEKEADVQVTELLTPRTAILLSGGMYPESTSESDTDDYDVNVYYNDEVEPERDSNMSSYGSGILVTQYTSGDSDDEKLSGEYNEQHNGNNVIGQNTKVSSLAIDAHNRNASPMKIHSPLDFTFLDSNCETTQYKQEETRSPRVFGRHYSEFDKYILDEASMKTSEACHDENATQSHTYIKEPFYLGLNPEQRHWDEVAESFTNVEFKSASKELKANTDRSLRTQNNTEMSNKIKSKHDLETCKDDGLKNQSKKEMIEQSIKKNEQKKNQNLEKVIAEKTKEDMHHQQKETKTSTQPKPVKIQVSHLSRKGSFTNKVKKGYVHQLSELFQQKEGDTTQDTKKISPTLKKGPEQMADIPKMILPKENLVISTETREIDPSSTNAIDIANESLGFEVTSLQKVDTFDEITSTSLDPIECRSNKYEDDFESDTSDSNSETSDLNLKLYEHHLKDRVCSDSDSSQRGGNVTGEGQTSDDENSQDEDDIHEEIEGRVESEDSEDEELYLKIHGCHPKVNVNVQSNPDCLLHTDRKVETTQIKEKVTQPAFNRTKETIVNRSFQIKTEKMHCSRSFESDNDMSKLKIPQSTDDYAHSYASKSNPVRANERAEKRQSENEKSDMLKTHSDGNNDKIKSSVDLGGIFWSQNVARYKPIVPVCTKSQESPKSYTDAGGYECSLYDTFSRLESDRYMKRKIDDSSVTPTGLDHKQMQNIKKRKTDGKSTETISSNDTDSMFGPQFELKRTPEAKMVSKNDGIYKVIKAEVTTEVKGRSNTREIILEESGGYAEVAKKEERPGNPPKASEDDPYSRALKYDLRSDISSKSDSVDHCPRPGFNQDEGSDLHYPHSHSKQLYGSYCHVQNIKRTEEERGATPSRLLQHSGLKVTPGDDKSVPVGKLCKVSPSSNGDCRHDDTCHIMSNTTVSNHGPLSLFEYPQGDRRNSYFRKFISDKSNQEIDEESRLNYDPADQFIENIDGRIIYPEVFEYSCYDVKTPILSQAQRESLYPRSSPIKHCTSIEEQRGHSCDILFSNSNHPLEVVHNDARENKQQFDFSRPGRCNDSRRATSSPVNVKSNAALNSNLPYVNKQPCVHGDITEGGLHTTAVKNDFFHEHLGVCLPKEISNVASLRQKGDMRNDMQTNEMKQRQPLAVSEGINGLSLRQTSTIYHPRMSVGDVFTYDDHDANRNVLAARGGGATATVLIQTLDGEHVLEDEKGHLKIWPYSDFEDTRKLPVTLHRAQKKIKLFVRKAGMSQPPSNMTVIQTALHSTEMPENRMTEKYHSSAVLPENRNIGELMQTHGESVQSVLFKDTNGNMLTEEEFSAILPKLAESISKMKDVDAEEILPGITQSVTKLQSGGNLVITTMTRKLDGEESDESGRGSPVQPHPVLNVDDLDTSKIFLVQDSKGELFYVEDITSESQESAYFSSRNTSESISDGGYSPAHGISQIKQVGKSNIRESTAEEILSAMYDQDGIQEITENEEEWSERTYEYDRPRVRNVNPAQSYSKNSFKQSYMVEEPETLPRGKAVSHQDRFESSYAISGSMPWVYDGGVSQPYSQATQGHDEMDSASAISGHAGGGFTRTTERLTVEAETEIYPLVPVEPQLPPVPYVPPLAVQADTPQYSLVKVDVAAKKPVSPKLDVPELSQPSEADDRPIYKTVAHIHTREKQPPVKSEMAESKKYKIISSKATATDEEEQETRMSLAEVDYKFSAENVEYKASPTVQHTQYYFRNATNLEPPKRYTTEKKLELNNVSDQKYKSEIQVLNNNVDKVVDESNFYSYDQMKTQMEHTDTSMRVVRGSYLIKNNLEEIDDSLDDNLNMFDGDFTLTKDNPLYQSDEDLYKRYEREKNELAQKQQHFQRNVNQDISFETVDRYSKSKTVQREERPKQSLSEILLSRLSTVDSKDIRQKIDVKHHSEDIYGDPRFLHADGTSGEASYSSRSDFDTVGEKVDLLIKDGKAFITVKVTAERIVPLDLEFNVWRKNQAIVTRTIEVDLLATEQRRRLYYKVMEEPAGGAHGSYRSGPNETVLDSKQTLELFTKILGAADGEGDKEDITVRTRSGRTTRPFTSGMDLLY